MKYVNFKWLTFIFILLFFSCLERFSKEEIEKQKKDLKLKIASTLPENVTIFIFSFENKSKNEEIDYLSVAIPDLIEQYTGTLEYEHAYLPVDYNNIKMPSDLLKLINNKNSYFYSYVTNFDTTITQFVTNVFFKITNIEAIQTNIVTTGKKKTKIELVYLTNTITNYFTNYTISNIIKTNLTVLETKSFFLMLSNEIPEFISEACYFPVKLENKSKEEGLTNLSFLTNYKFYITLSGSYKIFKDTKSGPRSVEIEIISSNFLLSTNVFNYTIRAREDLIHEEMTAFIKTFRRKLLNKPCGDLIVRSEPDDVSIYLDGVFIGRTPLYFPSVLVGSHRITFSKQGYKQVILNVKILEELTNVVFQNLKENVVGGVVKFNSVHPASRVFIDSQYIGKTPLVVSNLTLFEKHRVSIYSTNTNLAPFYHSFVLNRPDDNLMINASFKNELGSPLPLRQTLWNASFFCWGTTIYMLGMNIYSHYLSEYYKDEYVSYGKNDSKILYEYYEDRKKVYFNFFLLSSVISMGMTAVALNSEDIYFGIMIGNERNIFASLNFRY
ncbi:MAG: PEGA domain-containing protein [Brevinematia bacterium]